MDGAASVAGDVVVPVLVVDRIGTRVVSLVEGGTSVRAVLGLVSGNALPVAIAAGEDDLDLVV